MQVREGHNQLALMAEKLEKKRFKREELKAAFIRDNEERLRTQFRQQQLELQSRVQVRCCSALRPWGRRQILQASQLPGQPERQSNQASCFCFTASVMLQGL